MAKRIRFVPETPVATTTEVAPQTGSGSAGQIFLLLIVSAVIMYGLYKLWEQYEEDHEAKRHEEEMATHQKMYANQS